MRRLLLMGAIAVLVAACFSVPAQAGTGPSQWCNDGHGEGPVEIVSSPVTLNLQLPSTGEVWVCYSTTAWGDSTPAITGGALHVTVLAGVAECTPDPTVAQALTCYAVVSGGGVSISLTPRVQSITAGVAVTSGAPSGTCLRGLTIATSLTDPDFGPFDVGVC